MRASSYRGSANSGCSTSSTKALNHGLDNLGNARAVDSVVDSIWWAHLLDLGNNILFVSKYSLGGAELFSEIQPTLLQVDSDDFLCAADFSSHDGTHANGANSKDRHRLARLDVEGVENGTGSGLQTATQWCT